MDSTIHLPRDFQLSGEFNGLADRFGPVVATFLWAQLAVKLAFEAEATERVGWIAAGVLEQFLGKLNQVMKPWTDKVVAPADLMVYGVMAEQDGGYFCRWFARGNPHLDGKFKPSHQVGYEKSRFVRFQRQLHTDMQQLLLLLPSGFFKKPDGSAMLPDEMKQVVALIMCLDNILGRGKARLKSEFTEGLLAAAWREVSGRTPRQLEGIYEKLIRARGKLALPSTAEELLGELGNWEKG